MIYPIELTKHKLYTCWQSAKKRARQYKVEFYKDWLNYTVFYYDLIDKYIEGYCFARIDNTKGFTPSNCIFKLRSDISSDNGKKGIGKKIGKPSEENLNKRKQTLIAKYGVEFPGQIKEAKEKRKKTCLEKYGVENSAQSKIVKEKFKQTCLIKYGVEHHTKSDSYKQKAKERAKNSGLAIVYNGKTTEEAANELGMSRSGINARIRKYGHEKAFSMQKEETCIESSIRQLLDTLNVKYEFGKQIENRFTDFLLLDYNLIIECDGLYWHSDKKNTDKYYHRDKMRLYNSHGYKSLFFRENEIINKFNIITSMIKHRIGMSNNIYARKCIIEEISNKEIRSFMDSNHLMGPGQGSAFVLKHQDEIVAGMQIVNRKDYVDISRFSTKQEINVVGGFSRLLKTIENKYQKDIHTFIDRRYGSGHYLNDLGFNLVNEDISFVWVKNEKVVHRLKFPGNSGYKHGWNKLWDCGQAKYIKKARNKSEPN
jgi:very-short-patch-repair endonuclease